MSSFLEGAAIARNSDHAETVGPPRRVGQINPVPQMLFGLPPEDVSFLFRQEQYCERNNKKCKTEFLAASLVSRRCFDESTRMATGAR
jgi:hypothetical protein